MNTAEHAVSIRGVSKQFGRYVAVDRVDLDIGQGEFFSILGPSGCGKSTLLRLIAGLEWPDEGTVSIDGRDMTRTPAYRRSCNMVFQNYAIFPHLDVRANIAYGLRNLRLPRAERASRVEEVVSRVRLGGLEARKPGELSGGQRQRVALARALVRRPRVLLLDEPLSALDKTLREQMQIELRALQQSVGITFVLVTHDQEEALSMSDRIAVMSNGCILQIASPQEVYERPNCTTVARFIGDMNFLSAITECVDENGTATVDVAGLGKMTFRTPLEGDRAGLQYQVAVRPERLRLSAERDDTIPCVPCAVISCAYWGDQSHIQVAVDSCEDALVVAAHNAAGSGLTFAQRGDRAWLGADPAAFLRFCEREN